MLCIFIGAKLCKQYHQTCAIKANGCGKRVSSNDIIRISCPVCFYLQKTEQFSFRSKIVVDSLFAGMDCINKI